MCCPIGPSMNLSRSSSRCVTTTAGSAGAKAISRPARAARRARAAGRSAPSTPRQSSAGHARTQRRWSPRMAMTAVAATALLTAIEMLEGHPLLKIYGEARLPLLTPFNSAARRHRNRGRTAAGGRLSYLQDQGRQGRRCRPCARAGDPARHRRPRHHAARRQPRLCAGRCQPFRRPLDPIRHRAVRAALPCRRLGRQRGGRERLDRAVMLDEPICGLDDIERAGDIRNVGFCKLKLKRFGSLDALRQALETVRALRHGAGAGRRPVERAAMLDGGLRRPPCHPQRRRVQRLSEAEGAAVRRAAAV